MSGNSNPLKQSPVERGLLGARVMFFIALVSVFFVDKNTGHITASGHYVNDWKATALPAVLWFNTAVLLLSSVTIEIARRHMFHQIEAMEEWFGLGKPTSRRALPSSMCASSRKKSDLLKLLRPAWPCWMRKRRS